MTQNNKEESEVSGNTKYKDGVNRNARLIVRNISFKATEDSLREHFSRFGTVEEVKLLRRPDGKLVGCGFVHYTQVPMAKKAVTAANKKPFLGRPISVDWAVAKHKYMQHIVNQQLDMQDDVKKEDSDSDDNGPPLDISTSDLKEKIKSESDDDSVKEEDESSAESNDEDNSDDEDDVDDDEEEPDEDDDNDKQSQTSTQPDWKRTKLNDAEDGCTVFVTNIPFSVDNDQLRQFAEATAPVQYALVCVDKMTEHSKGSGFIKFTNKEGAEKFQALPSSELRLEGQTLQARPALKRENLQKQTKQPKDNRNLYLVKEGVVVAGSVAAVGVSASDMAKRLALERSKTQMLKNLNRFVSRYRLVVSNLPASCTDARLRQACGAAAGRAATVTEARVMRDLRAPQGADGQHPSKGYGFVMFTRHEDALACLRKMNNNPDIFDKNNRPIVSFSIEDRTALNARKKRLEKSIANNPLANKTDAENQSSKNRKRKNMAPPDESYVKKGRMEKNKNHNDDFAKKRLMGKKVHHNENSVGKYVRRPRDDDIDEYTGLTAKEGNQHKMRSNHKLKQQADVHRQQVKMEKKKGKRAMRLKMAAKERVKQPKQKINKAPGKNNRRKKFKSNDIRDILK